MTIAAILQGKGSNVVTIDADESVAGAVTLLAQRRIGAMPVIRNGKVAGIFSERDMVYRLHSDGAAILDARVGDVMTAPAITVSPDQSTLNALALMTRRRIRHLPVVAGGQLVGLVSIGDLVKRRIDDIEREAAALRDYITGI